MESRKVQMTGKSTYIVSLPKKWVTKVKIKNGDTIVLIPKADGTILLKPTPGEDDIRGSVKVINTSGQDADQLTRKFIGAYLAGYDIIEITNPGGMDSQTRLKIGALTRSVIGPEIIDETTNSVMIKDLLDASNFSMQKGLKRMHLIAKEMHREAFASLTSRGGATNLESRDDEVDKFYWMVAKQYNMILKDVFYAEKLDMTPQVALGYLLVARSVERIADHAAKVAANAANIKKRVPISPDVAEASNKLLDLMERAISAFYKGDFDAANEVVIQARSLEAVVSSLSHEVYSLRLDPVSVVSMAYIIDSLGRTLSYTVDIAEAAINQNFIVGQPTV